ncbi:N-acetylmuramoyl-L-alanine amidase [Lacrimispora xylanolytica]|uniref:N-acetylmuramoyl-L-alanine amidase n=2 Tax=Lachnospiraceae TaxID=186803 RepID=A0ABY7ACS1_9FIRM|nr:MULTISPECIES: N-acetylmuramoyl-L-alanine amidase [Lacrimispora]WAJ23654.1 N-acetylmuramoyl-L-alanine amidase [Lacrimispora xylanolytica]
MKLKKWEPFMAVILLVLVYVISSQAGKMTAGVSVKAGKEKPVVVIDAGHGGNDPGKIGVDGTLEKDINLQIAYRLKKYLEASDVDVVLTRKNDNGLYTERDSKKKMADMTKRCDIINDTSPDLTVSIHQNSYHQEEISGGQVFYYKRSDKGKRLAEILQERFDYVLGDKNTRLAKPNDNYYLLLHVKTPIVIVECGFLTNWKEAGLLNSDEYQDRLAWTIHMGIMEYLNAR